MVSCRPCAATAHDDSAIPSIESSRVRDPPWPPRHDTDAMCARDAARDERREDAARAARRRVTPHGRDAITAVWLESRDAALAASDARRRRVINATGVSSTPISAARRARSAARARQHRAPATRISSTIWTRRARPSARARRAAAVRADRRRGRRRRQQHRGAALLALRSRRPRSHRLARRAGRNRRRFPRAGRPRAVGRDAARSRHDNRTRRRDYAAAIGDRTGSSFACTRRISASKASPSGRTARLVGAGPPLQRPLVEDLGSGWLGRANRSPTSRRCDQLAAAPIWSVFSGDKLPAGPSVRRRRPARLRRAAPRQDSSLMRALRADKSDPLCGARAKRRSVRRSVTYDRRRSDAVWLRMLPLRVAAAYRTRRRRRVDARRLPRAQLLPVRIRRCDGTRRSAAAAPRIALPTQLCSPFRSRTESAAPASPRRADALDLPIDRTHSRRAVVLDLRTRTRRMMTRRIVAASIAARSAL